MKKWMLVAAMVVIGALAFAACSDDNNGANTESASDGDDLPQISDDATVPGSSEYRVTVSFNEDAVQDDFDAFGALLAGYDESAAYVIQESLPPTVVATLTTDTEDFCETAVSLLEAEVYVTVASCGPQLEPGDVDNDDIAPGELTDSDCEPVELRSDCGIDPDVCNEVHNIDACTSTDVGEVDPSVSVSPVCAPDFPDCEDMIVNTCDGDDCTGDNEVEEDLPPSLRPAAEGQYTLTIRFNETVLLDELDEVGAMIRDFDPDAVYVIQESFPPTGVATVFAETEDFCLAIVPELEAETFITSVSCGPQLEPGDDYPEEPVVNDLE